MTKEATRVLVIGLDGATFDLIGPWMREGRLPNLARLVKSGVSGELESTVPPVTLPAWISFATGKNPGKLGVYDLVKKESNGYSVQLSNPSSLREMSLWNYLNNHGIRTGIINVPGAFPPRKIDGFMIPGMFTPSERGEFSYPGWLRPELDRRVHRYELDVDHWRYFDEDRFLMDIYRVTQKHERAVEYLMGAFDVQFFMVVFTSTDRIQHVMWRHMDPTHPQHDPIAARRYSSAIRDYWQSLDRAVGEVVRAFGEGTIMVVSDHGFGPRRKTFYVNEWLRRQGFLRLGGRVRRGLLSRLGWAIEKLFFRKGGQLRNYYLGKMGVYHLLAGLVFRILGRERVYGLVFKYVSLEEITDRIDWARTKAFSCAHTSHLGHIYINLRGREPEGSVDPGDYEKVRDEIIERLGRLEDPVTGERLKTEIHRPEEIYTGPYVDRAPDIIFSIEDSECEVDISFGHASLFLQGSFDLRHTGTHKKNGVFIASGPDIRGGAEIRGAKITDPAPTILHLYGIPVPRDMDGRVLSEIFQRGSGPAEREVMFSEPEVEARVIFETSEVEEMRARERLRRLGYLA